jgi:hypothetical protein
MSNLVASLKIVAQNGASKVFGQIANDAKKMGADIQRSTKAVESSQKNAAFREAALSRQNDKRRASFALKAARDNKASAAVAIASQKAIASSPWMKIAEQTGFKIGRGIRFAAIETGKFALKWAAIGATTVAAGLAAAGFSVIKNAAKFEVLEADLEAVEKSSIKAGLGFAWGRAASFRWLICKRPMLPRARRGLIR